MPAVRPHQPPAPVVKPVVKPGSAQQSCPALPQATMRRLSASGRNWGSRRRARCWSRASWAEAARAVRAAWAASPSTASCLVWLNNLPSQSGTCETHPLLLARLDPAPLPTRTLPRWLHATPRTGTPLRPTAFVTALPCKLKTKARLAEASGCQACAIGLQAQGQGGTTGASWTGDSGAGGGG